MPSGGARNTLKSATFEHELNQKSEGQNMRRGSKITWGGSNVSQCYPDMWWLVRDVDVVLYHPFHTIITFSIPSLCTRTTPKLASGIHLSISQIWGPVWGGSKVSWDESKASHCHPDLCFACGGTENVGQHSHTIITPSIPPLCCRTTTCGCVRVVEYRGTVSQNSLLLSRLVSIQSQCARMTKIQNFASSI